MKLWIRGSRIAIQQDKRFPTWKTQFSLLRDGRGLWRCGGRLQNEDLPYLANHPILLNKKHHLIVLGGLIQAADDLKEDQSVVPPQPPLPDFHMKEAPPFMNTVIDFAGPLYLCGKEANVSKKVRMSVHMLCVMCSVLRACS